MGETHLDRLSVSSLQDRYSLVRSAVYTRLKQLSIEPEREGKKSYVDGAQLALLDEFDGHIKRGGSIADFKPASGQLVKSSGQMVESSGQLVKSSGQLVKSSGQMIESSGQSREESFMLLLEQMAERLRPVNPLSSLEALEQAAEKGWLLSTSQLAPLVKLTRKSLIGKKRLERFGFTITKASRNGAESAWRISK